MAAPRVHIGRCRAGIRHWFTVYGAVGAPRSNCGHCRMPHPTIMKALERGLYYAKLYSPVEDDEGVGAKDAARQARDIELLREALERVSNEVESACSSA